MKGGSLIIAFDIDDTISRHPGFFAVISDALVRAGHQVLIVTLREGRAEAERDLADWGIRYTKLITATEEDLDRHGFNQWKASVCRAHGVEVFFEDSPEILRHVDTCVSCFMPIDPEVHDLELLCYS